MLLMKKFYTAFVAAMFAATSFAQPLAKVERTSPLADGLSRYLPKQLKKPTTGKPVGVVMPSMSNNKALSARMRKAADNADIISEQPEGTLHDNLYGSGEGFMMFFNNVYTSAADGNVERYVEADNGVIYLQNAVCTIAPGNWIKGEKAEGDTIQFEFPQKYVAQEELDNYGKPTGNVEYFYLFRCKLNEEQTNLEVDEATQTIKYILRNDSLIRVDNLDKGVVLALCNGMGQWTGFGDYYQTWTKLKDEACVPPETAFKAKYQIDYVNKDGQDDARIINVAIDGNDLYLGELTDSAPENWAKGKIDGSKAVFDGKIYMGVDKANSSHTYFSGLGCEKVWSDYYYQDVDSFYFENAVTFDYDADAKTLKTNDMFGVNLGTASVSFVSIYNESQLKPWANTPGSPKDPELLQFRPYDPNYGYGAMLYWLDKMSVDDYLLDANNLYYNIFLDGDVFTAYPDEYVLLKEEMTDVPYNFSDGYDFNFTGNMHNMFFYVDGFTTVGLQAFYKDGDNVYKSNLVEYEITEDGFVPITGIKGTTVEENNVKSVSFSDLSGRRVSSLASGIYLKTMKMADGTVKTVKVVKR